jgi:hypothetical protein
MTQRLSVGHAQDFTRPFNNAAAKAHLREAWEETAAGGLPLVEWRLHAVEATRERGDVGAAHHRNAWTEAFAELARTLPAEHIGQQTR